VAGSTVAPVGTSAAHEPSTGLVEVNRGCALATEDTNMATLRLNQ
jgi:hypothetical protein